MMIEIHNDLNADEYNKVRLDVGWKKKKQGIGKRLVNAVIDDMKNRTMVGEYSTVNLISIRGMEKFYERCGFAAVPFGYSGKGMRMRIEK